jgi:hypothetical protein
MTVKLYKTVRDIEKKTKEAKDKVQGLIPEFMGTEKKSNSQEKEGSKKIKMKTINDHILPQLNLNGEIAWICC